MRTIARAAAVLIIAAAIFWAGATCGFHIAETQPQLRNHR